MYFFLKLNNSILFKTNFKYIRYVVYNKKQNNNYFIFLLSSFFFENLKINI